MGLSRTQIRKAIEKGEVLVNGRKVKVSYRVKSGDEIVARIEVFERPDKIVAEDREVNIIYEDEDIIVINKPAGQVVHPAKGHFTGTVVNALYYKLLNAPGAERKRPGIVHRLDKDTSGVMVIGKSEKAVRNLARQMVTREARRVYLAVVWGSVDKPGTVEAPIGKHPISRERMAITVINSKPAITEYEPVKVFGGVATLLRLNLKTGRTHQIRVHMEYLGHPVIGDPVYSGRNMGKIMNSLKGIRCPMEEILKIMERQALHAWKLILRHPSTNKTLQFTAPILDF